MARTPSRQQILQRAQQGHSPRKARSGGTTAPRQAGRGPTTGLNRNRPARPAPRLGLGGNRPAPAGGKGGGPSGSGGGPAGAASPHAPPPWDSRFESTVGNARAAHQRTSRGLDRSKRAVEQDYGLAPGYNDYQANPFSRAALLQDAFKRGNRAITGSAGYQLYSGSTGNKLASNRRDYGQQRHELESEYQRELREIAERRAESREQREEDITDATYDRNVAAEETDLDPDAVGPPSKKKGAGKPKPKRGKKRGRGRKKNRPKMGIGPAVALPRRRRKRRR